MAQRPNSDDLVFTYDTKMANLDVGTIWFQDDTFLNSAKGIIGAAGGLSFQYTLNINNQAAPIGSDLNDGTLRFNDSTISNSTLLYLSTNTHVLSSQGSSPIDMKDFFRWVNQRDSNVKTLVSIVKLGDSSKKAIYSVSGISVDAVYTNATFTLDREISLISEAAPFVQGEEVIVSFEILGDKGGKGDAGINGDPGLPGNPGEDGSFGGATFDYTFNDTTTTNVMPNETEIRLNNANGNESTSTHMYLSWSDDNGVAINQFMNTISSNTLSAIKGFVRIQKKDDPSKFLLFEISSILFYGPTFFDVTISNLSASAIGVTVPFIDGDDVLVSFVVHGHKGEQGVSGLQGPKGMTGGPGLQGEPGGPGLPGGPGGPGEPGVPGTKGTTGGPGLQGEPGGPGLPGGPGGPGEPGLPGPKGTTGGPGLQGEPGGPGLPGGPGGPGGPGEPGEPGVPGTKGTTGGPGLQGDPGNDGLPFLNSAEWLTSGLTSNLANATPESGKFFVKETNFVVHPTSTNNENMLAWIDSLAPGDTITFTRSDNSDSYGVWEVESVFTPLGGLDPYQGNIRWKLGTINSIGDIEGIKYQISRNGPRGPQGPAGTAGTASSILTSTTVTRSINGFGTIGDSLNGNNSTPERVKFEGIQKVGDVFNIQDNSHLITISKMLTH